MFTAAEFSPVGHILEVRTQTDRQKIAIIPEVTSFYFLSQIHINKFTVTIILTFNSVD